MQNLLAAAKEALRQDSSDPLFLCAWGRVTPDLTVPPAEDGEGIRAELFLPEQGVRLASMRGPHGALRKEGVP